MNYDKIRELQEIMRDYNNFKYIRNEFIANDMLVNISALDKEYIKELYKKFDLYIISDDDFYHLDEGNLENNDVFIGYDDGYRALRDLYLL